MYGVVVQAEESVLHPIRLGLESWPHDLACGLFVRQAIAKVDGAARCFSQTGVYYRPAALSAERDALGSWGTTWSRTRLPWSRLVTSRDMFAIRS